MGTIPIQLEGSYTFADYFKLTYETEDILNYFGYDYRVESLTLPSENAELDRLDDLKNRLEEIVPYISLSSEIARRELMIAPVLMDVIHYTQAKLRIGYTVKASEQLKGELDYYLETQNNLLVIEAKNADLQKGFTQLATELIAMDHLVGSDFLLYGAVSTGNIWQFGVLKREPKQIIQDFNLFRSPTDLEALLQVLVAILKAS
ncbi:MAG: hypothetical protein AAFX01_07765 [Cyanobacteria bacterium J06638_28]